MAYNGYSLKIDKTTKQHLPHRDESVAMVRIDLNNDAKNEAVSLDKHYFSDQIDLFLPGKIDTSKKSATLSMPMLGMVGSSVSRSKENIAHIETLLNDPTRADHVKKHGEELRKDLEKDKVGLVHLVEYLNILETLRSKALETGALEQFEEETKRTTHNFMWENAANALRFINDPDVQKLLPKQAIELMAGELKSRGFVSWAGDSLKAVVPEKRDPATPDGTGQILA